MISIGTLDIDKYSKISPNILTDEIVLTDNQLQHILNKRADTYLKYHDNLLEIINEPDYILSESKHADTALVIKKYENSAILVLRLATENNEKKNSIITLWEIKEPRLKRYLSTKKVVYIKE